MRPQFYTYGIKSPILIEHFPPPHPPLTWVLHWEILFHRKQQRILNWFFFSFFPSYYRYLIGIDAFFFFEYHWLCYDIGFILPKYVREHKWCQNFGVIFDHHLPRLHVKNKFCVKIIPEIYAFEFYPSALRHSN